MSLSQLPRRWTQTVKKLDAVQCMSFWKRSISEKRRRQTCKNGENKTTPLNSYVRVLQNGAFWSVFTTSWVTVSPRSKTLYSYCSQSKNCTKKRNIQVKYFHFFHFYNFEKQTKKQHLLINIFFLFVLIVFFFSKGVSVPPLPFP